MRLISWNVNGLRACLTKGFGDYFADIQADAFCLQETKMQPGQADFDPEGYEQYFNSAEKKGYSGTAIFTRMKPLSVRYGLGIEEHDHEGRVITLEFDKFFLVRSHIPQVVSPAHSMMAWSPSGSACGHSSLRLGEFNPQSKVPLHDFSASNSTLVVL